jgi:DMSO reductase family type II enzyme heme b subunit
MKAARIKAGNDELLKPGAAFWSQATKEKVALLPTPLAMVQELSPFLAISQGHGAITALQVEAVHNGEMLAVRLSWAADKHDRVVDLNGFVDGAAVMFPTVTGASAITMGEAGKPVNAWYWKADQKVPYEVLAEGFRFVNRQKDNAGSDLKAAAVHADGRWQVVFRRSLGARNGLVRFAPKQTSGIAFAVWSGAHAERSGRKAFSGDFVPLELA